VLIIKYLFGGLKKKKAGTADSADLEGLVSF